jgi:ABC-type bacteriocin/lantibiotic exporter with double-glycine peptidase domain
MEAEIFLSAANWRPPAIARAIIRAKRLMKGRTVITIAHRLSTIRDTNNIIVNRSPRRLRSTCTRRRQRRDEVAANQDVCLL